MQSRSDPNPIDLLEHRLGADWSAIKNARESAVEKRAELRAFLVSLDSDDTSIVVFGSLARDEFTSGSDIDWTLLLDGFVDAQHLNVTQEIQQIVGKHSEKNPGPE